MRAGLRAGSGKMDWEAELGLGRGWCWLWEEFGEGGLGEKVEVLERVEEGCTGPRERRERAKSGSEASRFIAVTRKGVSEEFHVDGRSPAAEGSLMYVFRAWGEDELGRYTFISAIACLTLGVDCGAWRRGLSGRRRGLGGGIGGWI